ncbi:MAG: hypothetical protein J6S67_20895 [Methanobrevibacter sp.]|nr:hypothetical protein [Methanobrevibacter sp.]
MYKCKYFSLKELVSPAVYNHFGTFAWNFLDEGMLRDLDLLRELWKKPLIINNWQWGGTYKESGFRCNQDSIVKEKKRPYCSAHCLGRGFDVKPEIIEDCKDLYKFIQLNYHKFGSISRLEDCKSAPTWCHIDNFGDRGNSIQIFRG